MPSPAIIFAMTNEDGVVVVDCQVSATGSTSGKGRILASDNTAIAAIPVAAAPAPTAPAPAPAPLPTSPSTLDDLLAELRGAFQAEKDAGHVLINSVDQDPASVTRLDGRVQSLLKAYALANAGDWKRFAMFNDLHYVRNLVDADDDFELIVLCWKRGQVSRVHNHADSHCWLSVLDGEMREVQYQRVAAPLAAAPASSCSASACGGEEREGSEVYVDATKTTDMRVGDAGYICDSLCLHSVGCYMEEGADAGQPEGGVTLHLYSPPIRRVKIYENNAVSERIPGFYSKGGVRV